MNPDPFTNIKRADPVVARAALLKHIAEQYRKSLFLLSKHALGYADVNMRTHGGMVQALEEETKRKLIVMPRGTFKSSIAVVAYSIWLMLNNPDIRILIDSEKYENSKNFIREIKGKLMLPKMIELFGTFQGDHGWNEGEMTIAQRTKIFKEATVTASGISAGKTGQHFDVIICDDLNTAENSQNQEQRKKIVQHYRLNHSILEPEGTMVVIGTRYATDDVIGHILKNEVNPRGLVA